MEENEQLAGTIPQETESQESAPAPTEPIDPDSGNPDEGDENGGEEMTVRYNHRDVTLEREEARTYAQKGMYYEALGLDRLYSELSAFAEQNGVTTEELLEQLTDDTAWENEEEEPDAAEPSREEQIAEEFALLQEQFDELHSYAQLPLAVRQAVIDGEDLINAYLYYLYTEQKAAAEARQTAERAERLSTGSVSGEDRADASQDAFLAGLWSR